MRTRFNGSIPVKPPTLSEKQPFSSLMLFYLSKHSKENFLLVMLASIIKFFWQVLWKDFRQMDISKAGELILESRNMRLMDFGRSQVSQGPPLRPLHWRLFGTKSTTRQFQQHMITLMYSHNIYTITKKSSNGNSNNTTKGTSKQTKYKTPRLKKYALHHVPTGYF